MRRVEEKSASSLHVSLLLIFYFLFKSMFPSESSDLQNWSWLVVCQGAWEHTFRNMFRSICQDVVFILVNNVPKQYTGLPPQ